MFKNITDTRNDPALAVLRVIMGVVYFAHGAQKLLGWFGGFGFAGTMGFFTGTVHIPYVLGVLVIVVEFFGGLALIVGVLSRVAAIGIAVDMIGAVLLVHLPVGFFMNWNGNLMGEGYEFHLIAIAASLVLLVQGSGAASIDRMLAPAGSTA